MSTELPLQPDTAMTATNHASVIESAGVSPEDLVSIRRRHEQDVLREFDLHFCTHSIANLDKSSMCAKRLPFCTRVDEVLVRDPL